MSDYIKIKAYTYPELDKDAKEKVRIWLDDWQFDKYDREWWTEELEKLGYSDADMSYSGFWSQGDGASISCSVNIQTFIKRHKLGKEYQSLLYWLKEVYGEGGCVNIKRSHWGHYVHEKLLYFDTNQIVEEFDSYSSYVKEIPEKAYNQLESIAGTILDEVVDKSRELYKWLKSDYEYTQTEEYLIDMCEANEYRFDEYGNPVHHLEVA